MTDKSTKKIKVAVATAEDTILDEEMLEEVKEVTCIETGKEFNEDKAEASAAIDEVLKEINTNTTSPSQK